MPATLYYFKASGPVRAVQITASALDVTLNEAEVALEKGEHLTPEFLKLNPQHTVPTLVDEDGFTVWDSHAIMTYLVAKHSKDNPLYPINELKKKAVIDQRLHFDSGVAFVAMRNVLKAVSQSGKLSVAELDAIKQVYGFLEAFLESTQWIAGDSVTIADYSIYTTITNLDALSPVDSKIYPMLHNWLAKVDKLPEIAVSKPGFEIYKKMVTSRLS